MLRLVPLGLAALSLGGFVSVAGTFNAFGPQDFVRSNGAPTPVTRSFSISDPTTSYTLQVNNSGVSSALISINGTQTFGPSDFNRNAAVLTKAVTLRANNQLAVELRGAPGGKLTIRITGVDNAPPVINGTIAPAPNAAGWNRSNVVVTFTCTDQTSGVASCSGPVTVSTEGAKQVISGKALDKAGNAATVTLAVNLDKALPAITSSIAPLANTAGWNNTNTTVSFACSDALSGVQTCSGPVSVATETSGQVVTGAVADRAGNTATATATVKLDKTPPAVAVISPVNGSVVTTPSATITGTVGDALSGIATLSCNGTPGVVSSGTFTCTVALTAGTNAITVTGTDAAGNSGVASLSLIFSPAPTLSLSSPANLSYVNISPITVNGSVSDPSATVSVNGIAAPLGSGKFSVAVPLIEGNNTLTAVAQNTAGNSGTASVQVTLDTTPPKVTIDSPLDGLVTTESSVVVTGKINDVVVGTVNPGQASVLVNGVPAQLANRSFVATGIPVALGETIVQAVGRDQAGNGATATITVRRDSPTQPRITVVSGGSQTGIIGSELPSPVVFKLLDGSGQPASNQSVVVKVTQNNGILRSGAARGATLAINTDAQGQAQVFWTLGLRSGAGSNRVEATAGGFSGVAVFTATGLSTAATQINADAGSSQTGVAGQTLPEPFVAVVTDAGHNRVANVPVTFSVRQGGGSFAGQSSVTTTTDSDGRAAAFLRLGPQAGIENNVVEASFGSNSGLPAAFVASGKTPGAAAQTRISGVVLDNSNNPVAGVTLRAFLRTLAAQSGQSIPNSVSAVSDAQGQFVIAQAPVGAVRLIADGTTAQRPGKWPNLEFDFVTVSGHNNTVGMPIYLLPLDSQNQLCVTSTTGGTLTLPQVPGFSLTVAPGATTFPGGSKSGCISVTPVHSDKVPMVPGFGQQPRFIVTTQPAGATFNPPASISFPNIDGLPARSVTEMYSFDHDLGTFVSIGTATVSEDARVVRSDSGVGLIKTGWTCAGNNNPVASAATCPDCRRCQGNDCIEDASQNGKQCNDEQGTTGLCNSSGKCDTCPTEVSMRRLITFNLLDTLFPNLAKTGVSAVAEMRADPDDVNWDGRIVAEQLTTLENDCPNITTSTGFNLRTQLCTPSGSGRPEISTFTIGASGGSFFGIEFSPLRNIFYDEHTTILREDILGLAGVSSCTAVCSQTFTCGGRALGTFRITKQFNHQIVSGQGASVLQVTKSKVQ